MIDESIDGKIRIGDWVLMRFGYESYEWYVLEISRNKVKIGKRDWLVSSAMWIDKNDFFADCDLLGSSKLRWWWRLVPWRDLVSPFGKYSIKK